jgi:hypothetical protein
MTEDEYEMRISRIRNKKRQLEKQTNSMELVFPPIDFAKEGRKLIEEIDDMLDELAVDDFLENGPGIKNKNI